MKILVSACLIGRNCKYNGGNNDCETVRRLGEWHELIPVCPEEMGGLPTPRLPSEIVDGTVRNIRGESVDEEFRRGAQEALKVAREEAVDMIVLQPRSPSCGVHEIYDGSFTGKRIPGSGIFAAMAVEEGFRVMDSEDLAEDSEAQRVCGQKTNRNSFGEDSLK